MNNTTTLSQLESHLWEAANILRGTVDAADFKTYVFPLFPHGALFRMGKEGEIRRKILQMDLLEAIIGLGPNLFYGTGLAACILVFHQRKTKDRKKKVLILDASREFKSGRAHNELLPEHVERIYSWYRDCKDVEGIARVVALDEIATNDWNLNIPRYVEPKSEQEVLTVEEAMERLKESAMAAFAAEEKLVEILKREGLLKILTTDGTDDHG
jgi:type I restriction enzyme M protein